MIRPGRGVLAVPSDESRVTLGPRSRCVLIEKKWGKPLVCDDGVTIAKEFTLKDPDETAPPHRRCSRMPLSPTPDCKVGRCSKRRGLSVRCRSSLWTTAMPRDSKASSMADVGTRCGRSPATA